MTKSQPTATGNDASSSPAKGSSGASRFSPMKGRKSMKDVKASKRQTGWYIRSAVCDGLCDVIYITNSNLVDDAFKQQLIDALRTGDEDLPINKVNILGSFYMCRGLGNNDALTNAKNGYTRQILLRVVDSEAELTKEARMEALKVIKEFLEQEENNKYGTKVYIPEPGWDLTPPDPEPLKKLDTVIQYKEIVRVINELFENVDGNWAVNNPETAAAFFTEGYIPFAAHADLGFPLDRVVARAPGIQN